MLYLLMICLLVVVTIVLFSSLRKRFAYQSRPNTVLMEVPRLIPLFVAGILLFTALAFSVLLVAFGHVSEAAPAFAVMLLFGFVAYLYCEWYSLAWRLEYSGLEDFFDYRDFWLRKKRLKYCDFQSYKLTSGGLVMKNAQNRIVVDGTFLKACNFVDVLNNHHVYQNIKK